jgi:hypothetical protein
MTSMRGGQSPIAGGQSPVHPGWQYLTAAAIVAALLVALTGLVLRAAPVAPPATPWTAAQTLTPDDLAQWLRDPASRPVVVYVGFRSLFRAGHLPAALYHGAASEPDGLTALRRWAKTQPPSTRIVIYCGCCPFEVCPNVKPAFEALRDAGLSDVHVLVLPTGFGVDWVEKGFPVDRK